MFELLSIDSDGHTQTPLFTSRLSKLETKGFQTRDFEKENIINVDIQYTG